MSTGTRIYAQGDKLSGPERCTGVTYSGIRDGVYFNPRPGKAFFITRPGRGGGGCDPPGVSKLSVVALREKKQSIALDEYSRLVVHFLTLGQHLT